ncbi:uncharacterized protein TNCV_1257541 [Trichonephila clavipes]|nr:uncharacterized protein TNCV_1257541 [Trichonephila clavipes]
MGFRRISMLLSVWVDITYSGRRIKLGGPVLWPTRSLDLTQLDLFLWGHRKELVSRDLVSTQMNICSSTCYLYFGGHRAAATCALIHSTACSSLARYALRTVDETHFWLNGYVNKQNCRIWSEANPQVYVETPLHPEKLTVWCALWAGGIIGPYFFKNDEGHNVTVNDDRYRAMITNFFIPELNNHDVQELWLATRRRNMSHSSCHNRFIERHVW